MAKNSFKNVAATESNPSWDELIKRKTPLYSRQEDIRGEFDRDYTRILHSMSYRRLKHKTQVFFNIDNDHICTRMEHVSHVESVSFVIAKYLGLNVDLIQAISIGHDLGHAPFGHHGENIIDKLSKEYLNQSFWHEKNGLRVCDKIDLLSDDYNINRNLDLTYAVRDGIISHCGEVDKNGLFPRKYFFPLENFETPGQYESVTWEGCVVKMADKIAYVGRDVEDAKTLGFLSEEANGVLVEMAKANDEKVLNTTVIMNNLIKDICNNSSPDNGITLSQQFYDQLTELKDFNYNYIYNHERLQPFEHYSKLILEEIFNYLLTCYYDKNIWNVLKEKETFTPELVKEFLKWLAKYCDEEIVPDGDLKCIAKNCENEKIYGDLSEKNLYIQAILDFISGMTDRYAIKVFNELINYY